MFHTGKRIFRNRVAGRSGPRCYSEVSALKAFPLRCSAINQLVAWDTQFILELSAGDWDSWMLMCSLGGPWQIWRDFTKNNKEKTSIRHRSHFYKPVALLKQNFKKYCVVFSCASKYHSDSSYCLSTVLSQARNYNKDLIILSKYYSSKSKFTKCKTLMCLAACTKGLLLGNLGIFMIVKDCIIVLKYLSFLHVNIIIPCLVDICLGTAWLVVHHPLRVVFDELHWQDTSFVCNSTAYFSVAGIKYHYQQQLRGKWVHSDSWFRRNMIPRGKRRVAASGKHGSTGSWVIAFSTIRKK